MTKAKLKSILDNYQAQGLNLTLRVQLENAIIYRKWGNLGKWGPFSISIINNVKKYQPVWLDRTRRLINEA